MRIRDLWHQACLLSAFLFAALSESQAQILTIEDPTPGGTSRFGAPAAIAGSSLLIGEHELFSSTTPLHQFDATTGAVLQTYADPAASTGGVFGFGVTFTTVGSLLVVGDPGDDVAGPDGGAVYVYDLADGALLRTMVNPSPTAGYLMGLFMVVRDGVVWAGANRLPNVAHFPAGRDIGVAYRFDLATGTLLQTVRNPSPQGGRTFGSIGPDQFGAPVLTLGGEVAVGGPLQVHLNAVERGVALYVFDDDGALVETTREAGIVPGFAPEDEAWDGVRQGDGSRFVAHRLSFESGDFVDRVDVVGPCGNSVVDPGEQCDEGNLLDGDCCSATCQLTVPGPCQQARPGGARLTLRRPADNTATDFRARSDCGISRDQGRVLLGSR